MCMCISIFPASPQLVTKWSPYNLQILPRSPKVKTSPNWCPDILSKAKQSSFSLRQEKRKTHSDWGKKNEKLILIEARRKEKLILIGARKKIILIEARKKKNSFWLRQEKKKSSFWQRKLVENLCTQETSAMSYCGDGRP